MRSVYYIDNNSEPALGARLALTFDLTDAVLMTVGASAMAGHLDPARENSYVVGGIDFYLRLWDFDVHAEYLLRRTEMALGSDPDSRFRYGPDEDGEYDDHFIKDGFYVEANWPLFTRLELVARVDGLRRIGNVLLNSKLRENSSVLRYTGGINIVLDGSVRLKFSGEFYDFTDFQDEFAANAGAVASF